MTEKSSEGLINHEPKKLRRLYEPLCLLHSLSEVRGDRIKPSDVSHDGPGFTGPRGYRRFVEAMAYICAYKKKPGYVTAVALEDTPEAIVVLLASNDGIDPQVISFVQHVRTILSWVIENHTIQFNKPEGQKVLKVLSEFVLKLNTPKIYEYYQQVMKTLSKAMQWVKPASGLKDDEGMIKLCAWFSENLSRKGIPLDETDMPALALSSYRDREVFKALGNHTGNSDKVSTFERLFKLLYKLGKHVAESKHLIQATIGLHSELARGLRVETISASIEKQINLVARTCNLDDMSKRIFKDENRNIFLKKLSQLHSTTELDRLLSKRALNGKTRVHCELLVLDHFEQTGGRFLFDQDRYIGCSKPACYLCHLFISCHPRGYAKPPSHQKLYMNWRLPDVHSNQSKAGIRYNDQRGILADMIRTVRRDLEQDITARVGQRMYCPDSTAGGTSTIVDIDCDLNLSNTSLSLEEMLRELKVRGNSFHSSQSQFVAPSLSFRDMPSPSTYKGTEIESDDDSSDGGIEI